MAKNVSKQSRFGEKNGNWKGGIYSNEKEYHRKYMQHYWKNNPAKQRAFLYKDRGSFTKGEWENLKAQYGFTCFSCRKSEPKIKLTIDHIIPLSKGGSNLIENIQPLCGSCNSAKQTKIIKF